MLYQIIEYIYNHFYNLVKYKEMESRGLLIEYIMFEKYEEYYSVKL